MKRRQAKQELVIVRTPYGEARFYKNADGTRSKVKLKKKRPQSPIGMEHKPVFFNSKSNLKEIEALEEDDEPTVKAETEYFPQTRGDPQDATNDIQEEGEENEGEDEESGNHTVSTIVESERVKFDNGIDESGIDPDGVSPDVVGDLMQFQKEDQTQFSKQRNAKLFYGT